MLYDKKIAKIRETLLFYVKQDLEKDGAITDDSTEPTGESANGA